MAEGSTLEITYDLKGTGITYTTAANLAIFPRNSKEDVTQCAKMLGWSLDQKFVFQANPNSAKKGTLKHPFMTPSTIREALQYFVDLRGALRKKTLKDISVHCHDKAEQDRLKAIADSKEQFAQEIEKK